MRKGIRVEHQLVDEHVRRVALLHKHMDLPTLDQQIAMLVGAVGVFEPICKMSTR